LGTAEGNVYFNELVTKPLPDRAKLVRETARAENVGDCPIAASYEAQQAVADYQRDLTILCASDGDMPGLKYDDEPTRVKRLGEWFAKEAKTKRMKDFGTKLLATAAPERASLLRSEGNASSVYVCDLANFISNEAATPPKGTTLVALLPPMTNGDI